MSQEWWNLSAFNLTVHRRQERRTLFSLTAVGHHPLMPQAKVDSALIVWLPKLGSSRQASCHFEAAWRWLTWNIMFAILAAGIVLQHYFKGSVLERKMMYLNSMWKLLWFMCLCVTCLSTLKQQYKTENHEQYVICPTLVKNCQ